MASAGSADDQSSLDPAAQIVQELDKHIVGQDAAKRAVAIALRNRWRRQQLRPELAEGRHAQEHPHDRPDRRRQDRDRPPPGASWRDAPFVKVEATKYTEVGYVGRDVDTIVRDLAEVAVKMTREQEMARVRERAGDAAEERVLDPLLPKPRMMGFSHRRAGGRA